MGQATSTFLAMAFLLAEVELSSLLFRKCFDWRPLGHRLDWRCVHACFRFLVLLVAPHFWKTDSVCDSSTSNSVTGRSKSHTMSTSKIRIRTERTESRSQTLTSHQCPLSSPDTSTTSSKTSSKILPLKLDQNSQQARLQTTATHFPTKVDREEANMLCGSDQKLPCSPFAFCPFVTCSSFALFRETPTIHSILFFSPFNSFFLRHHC